jgi:hypothetical protein
MQSTEGVPTLGAIAEQTRSSWAKPIASYAAVSPTYQGFVEPWQAGGRAFSYAVLAPSYEHFLHRTAERLVSLAAKFMFWRETETRYFILQPETRERVATVLGKTFYRTVFPTHMSILTDRELIMIGEEHRWSGEDRYGGTWHYLPLCKIVALSLSRKGSNWLSLSIQLPGSVCLDYLYEASARREVEQLLACAKELMTS